MHRHLYPALTFRLVLALSGPERDPFPRTCHIDLCRQLY